MAEKLSRRQFGKLVGAVLASAVAAPLIDACTPQTPAVPASPTPLSQMTPDQIMAALTPTQKAALGITATPAATDAAPATPADQATARVATATPTPLTFEELMSCEPSAQLAPEMRDQVEGSYSTAMGVDRKGIQLKPEKKNGKKGKLGVIVDAATQTPLYTAVQTKEGFVWREAALPDIASADGREVGVSVDGGDKNYQSPKYKKAAMDNSTLLMPDGAFMANSMKLHPEMAKMFAGWANESGARLRELSAFHLDQVKDWPEIKTSEQADAFYRSRLEAMIDAKYIRPGGRTEIVIAHEDTVQDWGDGREHWLGEGADQNPNLLRNPLFDVQKKEWPVKATQMAVQVAMEKGFKIGEDLVIAFSDFDLFQNTQKTTWFAAMLKRVVAGAQETANAMAKKLNVPAPVIKITTIEQNHMHADKDNARGWKGIWTGDIQPETIKTNVATLSAFGDVEASETDVSGTNDMNVKTDAMIAYSNAAFDAGANEIDFYQALRFDKQKPENISLFTENPRGGYDKTKMYWRLMQSWYQRVPVAA